MNQTFFTLLIITQVGGFSAICCVICYILSYVVAIASYWVLAQWPIKSVPSTQEVRPHILSCSCGMQCSSVSHQRTYLSRWLEFNKYWEKYRIVNGSHVQSAPNSILLFLGPLTIHMPIVKLMGWTVVEISEPHTDKRRAIAEISYFFFVKI